MWLELDVDAAKDIVVECKTLMDNADLDANVVSLATAIHNIMAGMIKRYSENKSIEAERRFNTLTAERDAAHNVVNEKIDEVSKLISMIYKSDGYTV